MKAPKALQGDEVKYGRQKTVLAKGKFSRKKTLQDLGIRRPSREKEHPKG